MSPDVLAENRDIFQRELAQQGPGRGAPTEHEEAVALAAWIRAQEGRYPQLRYMTHHEAGGHRHGAVAARIRAEGQRPGVPDYMLYWSNGRYVGLAIELKRADRSNHPTAEQRAWLDWLAGQGWRCEVAYGVEEAIRVIEEYLGVG
nr:VRR-NUC domain-containing protein [Caldilinea sp.]